MLFNSWIFALFLPVVLLGYYSLSRRWQNVFLLYHTEGSLPMVRRFMKPLQISVLDEPAFRSKRDQAIEDDFKKLWNTAKEMVT